MSPAQLPRNRARDTILRRRARFLALAVVGSGLAGTAAACACLSVQPPPPPAGEEPPSVIVDRTGAPGPRDAGAPAPTAEPLPQSAPPLERSDGGFQLCLSIDDLEGEQEPTPAVCLRAPDEDSPGA